MRISDVLTITPPAAAKLTDLLAQEVDAAAFRLEVVPGGCSGFRYQMGFDDPADGDLQETFDGLVVVVDHDSVGMLQDCTIDYSDTIEKSGFSIANKATRTCGCGQSFS